MPDGVRPEVSENERFRRDAWLHSGFGNGSILVVNFAAFKALSILFAGLTRFEGDVALEPALLFIDMTDEVTAGEGGPVDEVSAELVSSSPDCSSTTLPGVPGIDI